MLSEGMLQEMKKICDAPQAAVVGFLHPQPSREQKKCCKELDK